MEYTQERQREKLRMLLAAWVPFSLSPSQILTLCPSSFHQSSCLRHQEMNVSLLPNSFCYALNKPTPFTFWLLLSITLGEASDTTEARKVSHLLLALKQTSVLTDAFDAFVERVELFHTLLYSPFISTGRAGHPACIPPSLPSESHGV